GFDPGLADKGLFVGAEQYGRNLEDAVRAGVFGAPFYVLRETGQKFWGQDRLDFLAAHLAAI
ncbi:MAG: DsbA family protein, partial [Paracoccus sp. (in: a-proteobacteria)]|nr:DsbA family protein [Paracoccus sp. (in: a-proteobacteria)]